MIEPRESPAPELAVVMPIYNEASNISCVVRDWFHYLEELTPGFVLFALNDGSTDATDKILASLTGHFGSRLRVINKPNTGHGSTCREGYELALAAGAPWILQVDSDGQCSPAYFEAMYKARPMYDCLFAYRRSRGDGLGRRIISFCCRTLLWSMTGTYLRDPNVPYRLLRASALRAALHSIPADFNLQNIALTFTLRRQQSLRWKHFPIHFQARQGGINSINYRKIAAMGFDLLRDFRRLTHEDSHTWRRPSWARRRLAS